MELTKNIISNSKIIKSAIFVLIGTALLAMSSKIQTPFTLVPATMQTFVVMFLGIILGYKLATLTVILYLIEGSFGLPVFAKGGGIGYLLGPTGGYLVGFIFTAFFAGHINKNKDPIIVFLYLLFSVSLIYVLGATLMLEAVYGAILGSFWDPRNLENRAPALSGRTIFRNPASRLGSPKSNPKWVPNRAPNDPQRPPDG